MKKFEGILICTDLDGTLLKNDKSVSRENLDAIEYFKSEGGYFTFITGRMPFYVTDIFNTVKPNAPIGCVNGGGIFDFAQNKYLWTKDLSRGSLDLVDSVLEQVPDIGYQVSTFDRVYFCRDNSAMEHFRRVTRVPNIIKHHRDIDEPMAKILFADEDESRILLVKNILENHPRADEYDFIRSEKTLFEILPKGISKGSVLPVMAKILGVDMAKTVAIGDYNNDIEMIKKAGIGIAVANASPDAKKVADHITVSNEEHAIAQTVYDIENGILRI